MSQTPQPPADPAGGPVANPDGPAATPSGPYGPATPVHPDGPTTAPFAPHGSATTPHLTAEVEGSDREWPAMMTADAQRVLATWTAPTPADDASRDRILEFVADQGSPAATRALRRGHLTASAILLDASHHRVLLTLHHLARQWFQLGGHLEPGDTGLAAAALREATEESGIAGIMLDPVPLGVDWHAVTCRDVDGTPRPSQHLDVTFLTVAPAGAQPRITEESLDLRWFDVADLPGSVDDPVRRCVAEALRRVA